MIKKQPLLSICIPTIGRAGLLIKCLDNILFSIKGFENEIEIIIFDNASGDNTKECINNYCMNFPIITYYRYDEKKNDEIFYNIANLSHGKYIWILGDNRILYKDSICKILTEIKKNYSLIITNFSLYSLDNNHIVKKKYYNEQEDIYFFSHNELLKYFGLGLGHVSQVVFDRHIISTISYQEYIENANTGWAFLYMIYKGIYKNTFAVFLNDAIYIKMDKIKKLDWDKIFIKGSSFIFKKIECIGYDRNIVSRAKNKTVKDYIIPHIIYNKKNDKVAVKHYHSIYQNYRSSIFFWIYCLPIILIPSFVIKIISHTKHLLTEWIIPNE